MDNYFTSFNVLHALQNELGILAKGTIRRNRMPSYPFDDKAIAKECGNIDKRYNEESGVHLVAWQDNKCVVIASTLCGAQPCLLYTSPSPRDLSTSRMPSSA